MKGARGADETNERIVERKILYTLCSGSCSTTVSYYFVPKEPMLASRRGASVPSLDDHVQWAATEFKFREIPLNKAGPCWKVGALAFTIPRTLSPLLPPRSPPPKLESTPD